MYVVVEFEDGGLHVGKTDANGTVKIISTYARNSAETKADAIKMVNAINKTT